MCIRDRHRPMPSLTELNSTHVLTPVSYTHLDVYKRQLYNIPVIFLLHGLYLLTYVLLNISLSKRNYKSNYPILHHMPLKHFAILLHSTNRNALILLAYLCIQLYRKTRNEKTVYSQFH